MTSKSFIRKLIAILIAPVLATLIAWFIAPLITKQNKIFLSWDYLTLNRIGLWLYSWSFFSILIGGFRRKNFGIVLELFAIIGIVLLYPKYCTIMDEYSIIRLILDFIKGIICVSIFIGLGALNPFFSFLSRVMVYVVFYRVQYFFYLILHKLFKVSFTTSILITGTILLLIILAIFAVWCATVEEEYVSYKEWLHRTDKKPDEDKDVEAEKNVNEENSVETHETEACNKEKDDE